MHAVWTPGTPGTGKSIRMCRLFRALDGRSLVVPMDHSCTNGPLGPAAFTNDLVRSIGPAGADAVVLHKGRVRAVDPAALAGLGLLVHLSASTAHATDADDKVPVGGVDEAIACGADAVSVHVNIGSRTEAAQLAALGAIARACGERGVPLLAMMYARGERFDAESSIAPEVLAHLAAIATDLGADIVKLNWAGSIAAMRDVVGSCPLPILVAGGPRLHDASATVAFARDVVASGAAGLAMGRNIFEAPDPVATTRRVAKVLHAPADVLTAVV